MMKKQIAVFNDFDDKLKMFIKIKNTTTII